MVNADDSTEDNGPAVEIWTVAQDDDSAHAGILPFGTYDREEILYEHSFLEQAQGFAFQMPELQRDPTAIRLQRRLEEFSRRCSHLPDGHPGKYPPEARAVVDQLCDLGQAIVYGELFPSCKAKYVALAHRFRGIVMFLFSVPICLFGCV